MHMNCLVHKWRSITLQSKCSCGLSSWSGLCDGGIFFFNLVQWCNWNTSQVLVRKNLNLEVLFSQFERWHLLLMEETLQGRLVSCLKWMKLWKRNWCHYNRRGRERVANWWATEPVEQNSFAVWFYFVMHIVSYTYGIYSDMYFGFIYHFLSILAFFLFLVVVGFVCVCVCVCVCAGYVIIEWWMFFHCV
jgi:hypothetical protein